MARKESTDSKIIAPTRTCAGCGKTILSGLYCSACLEKFRDRAKVQGKRIEAMKSKSMERVAVDRHETIILIAITEDRNLSLSKILLERALPNYKFLTANTNFNAINTLIGREISLVLLDADYGGLDIPNKLQLKVSYGETPVHLGRALIDKLHHHRDEYEQIIVIGANDEGIEQTFDFSSVIERIEIDARKDATEHYDPQEVKVALLAKLR